MAQQIINLGTLADGSDGDTNKTAWGKAKGNFAELYARMAGRGYIDGLQMQWVSGTALTVSSGAAYIEGAGTVLRATSAIAKTSLSLTASTWYHVYLFENSGTPDFELSTTAPAAPYNGTARSKTGDTSRRYVGSIKTNASNQIRRFKHEYHTIKWIDNVANGTDIYRILSNGMATSATSFSGAACMPSTSYAALLRYSNLASSAQAYVSSGDYSPAGQDGQLSSKQGSTLVADTACDLSQSFKYLFTSTPDAGLYIDVLGYSFER